MGVLYCRVSDACADWVKTEAERSGLSVAKTVEAFLDHARREGWVLGERMVTIKGSTE